MSIPRAIRWSSFQAIACLDEDFKHHLRRNSPLVPLLVEIAIAPPSHDNFNEL
ncbi:hypothetical protein NC997_03330 [Trichocoleus sp. DQ-A2]|uniref:hypothetical protein n=1 Tax=Cyanophyceae TaxID=3028117 RepID=UPI00168684A2|nr:MULTISPECIES: hypothetical protein [unclassified Coleofasciculus]MBD1879561.1 hypothetical protein [Coleofasciculus sp. FACHB-T130]MBD1837847.1 hypothetical protein [Coleofasciculus sp. FACHB-501]MBD1890385.1 hypothetical protein [Coleofasciculus sp. FACHB-SPT9]MBD2083609.1 hypothetical protein [Coleofasciculus sp. FACHB-542]MBD2538267.1 hypothetical protein [Coleofasciculus sp. FACHB-SPT36]